MKNFWIDHTIGKLWDRLNNEIGKRQDEATIKLVDLLHRTGPRVIAGYLLMPTGSGWLAGFDGYRDPNEYEIKMAQDIWNNRKVTI